jgi:hypothetical protein
MKLFAVFVGGGLKQANIELHDLRFVTGDTIEATVPKLRAAWWGTPSSLHIDGYAELTHVEGHPIEVVEGPAPAEPALSLWFVNVGGYTPGLFGEQHHYLFMVGASKAEIWTRARQMSPDWTSRHKDNLATIDEVIDLNDLLGPEQVHILVGAREAVAKGPRIVSDYIKL